MSKTDIWMPIYIGDYLSATSRLSTEQHGAYLLLLMDYWKNGPPPDDDRVLAQIARMHPDAWSISRGTLQAFFDVSNGHWNHSRVERELEASKNRKAEATKKAHIAAEARWGKKNATSIAQALPEDMLGDASSPSSSPSSLSIPTTTPNEEPRKRVPKSKRLPLDWTLPDDWATWAIENKPGIDVQETAATFADYWHSEAKGKADWFATWRNWVRRQKVNTQSKSTPVSFAQQERERGWKRWEEMTGRQHPDRLAHEGKSQSYVIDVSNTGFLEIEQ